MDPTGKPPESTEVPDVEPILPETTENGYPEYLPPIYGAEDNEESPQHGVDTQRVSSDVEMDSVPPDVHQSDPEEDRTKPNDEPAGEQELHDESAAEHIEHVDNIDTVEPAYEGGSKESGLQAWRFRAHGVRILGKTERTQYRNTLRFARFLQRE